MNNMLWASLVTCHSYPYLGQPLSSVMYEMDGFFGIKINSRKVKTEVNKERKVTLVKEAYKK